MPQYVSERQKTAQTHPADAIELEHAQSDLPITVSCESKKTNSACLDQNALFHLAMRSLHLKLKIDFPGCHSNIIQTADQNCYLVSYVCLMVQETTDTNYLPRGNNL